MMVPSMYSIQTIVAGVLCVLGAPMMLVARHQRHNRDIGKVPLISWRAKHVIGLLMLIFSILIFLSQFIAPR
jgi:hypothetical protein